MNANQRRLMRLQFKTIEEKSVASLISFLKEKTGETFEIAKYIEQDDNELDKCTLTSLEMLNNFGAVKVYKAFIEYMTTTEDGGWLLFEEATIIHNVLVENLFRNEIEIYMLKIQAHRDTHRVTELSKELLKMKTDVSGINMFLKQLGIESVPMLLYMMDQQIINLGGEKSVTLVSPTDLKKNLH